jgi:gluconate 2-dehydrogenase subunit 3-like protein
MSNNTDQLTQTDGVSRRDMLRHIALALTAVAGGQIDLAAAQHVHEHARAEKAKTGTYKPKLFNEREFKTLGRLAELIVPADEISGSARDAGAPEFIDLLCSQNEELAVIYTGGLLWLDSNMQKRYAVPFIEAKVDQQTAMLDLLVAADKEQRERKAKDLTYEDTSHYKGFGSYGIFAPSDLGPGILFFDWVRKMTVDAFYTSEMGIKDVGYKGNSGMSKYEVPQEAIEYALKRSPFGSI